MRPAPVRCYGSYVGDRVPSQGATGYTVAMARQVVITGLGPVYGLGFGIESTWDAMLQGRCAIGPVQAFDATGFDCTIAAEIGEFKINQYVPKSYRKATKVMSRDIGLAVAAADLAARDAGLLTPGTDPDAGKNDGFEPTYAPSRLGAHIGAGLIAADLDELTAALVKARVPDGSNAGEFDIYRWGNEGINHLTPLWLLKYLPNMLACHVTIIHDAQGPSNTITCGEASAGLSIGESLRVIQRGAADACFCGGAESKVNPMAFLRQIMTGRVNTNDNDKPETAARPLTKTADGMVVGEGGGIVVLEAMETFEQRAADTGAQAYAQIVGFGASQSINPPTRNVHPDESGRGIAIAIRSALREAEIDPNDIDLIVPTGLAAPVTDRAEAAALRNVFGAALPSIPLAPVKSLVGNCGAGAGGMDFIVAAKAVTEQTIPAVINADQPLDDLNLTTAPAREADLQFVLTYSGGLGGQFAALVLRKF